LAWILELCEKWLKTLTPDGSLMLNIGSVFKEGVAAQQLHVERLLVKLEDELGVHLLQTLYWNSPTKMPTPLNWVGIKRLRVTQSVEPLLWLSPNPMAYGNNRHCLRPYSPEPTLRELRERELYLLPAVLSMLFPNPIGTCRSVRNTGGAQAPNGCLPCTGLPDGDKMPHWRTRT
jgi:hypothetical protein